MRESSIYNAREDAEYASPYVDVYEQRSREITGKGFVEYKYLHGGFQNTNVKFSFCIPEKESFEWRFFQHISPFPGPNEEMAALDKKGEDGFIGFCISHGSAYVESNMGSSEVFGKVEDVTIFYKSNAAVAEFFRDKVQEIYGEHRVYGYCFGGSGGGYKTMSIIENTNAFDGALPFVIGSPVSLPNCLTTAAYAARRLRNVKNIILDAVEPGGNGNPYEGLNKEDADAFREITNMGFPTRCMFYLNTRDDGSLPVLAPTVHEIDKTYFLDYWEKNGYQGSVEGGTAQRDRIKMTVKVVGTHVRNDDMEDTLRHDDRNGTDDAWKKMMVEAKDSGIKVDRVPKGDDLFLRGVDITVLSGRAKEKKLHLDDIKGNVLLLGASYGTSDIKETLEQLEEGDELLLDNSDYIAISEYHRHQVPDDKSFYCFDQYRDEEGNPNIPQRPFVISYDFTKGGCGSVQSGKVQGKVFIMNSLLDGNFPWQADWYKKLIEKENGDRAKNLVRIYYNDNAPHGDVSETGFETRLVSYLGMLRQGLLSLAAWTEKGIEPPKDSSYDLVDSQIILKEDAGERGGLQPVVKLLADGKEKVEITAGQSVRLTASISIPEGAGEIERIEWSRGFACDHDLEKSRQAIFNNVYEWEKLPSDEGVLKYRAEHEFTYDEPGTYYAVVKVTSNRNKGDVYTRLRNLARCRVVVKN